MSDKEKEAEGIANALMDKVGIKPCECGSKEFSQPMQELECFLLDDEGILRFQEHGGGEITDEMACSNCGRTVKCYSEDDNVHDFVEY